MRFAVSAALAAASLAVVAAPLGALSPAHAQAQDATSAAQAEFPASGDIVQDKNFPLLTLLAQDPAARAAILADPALARIGAGRRAALESAYADCAFDVPCFINAMMAPQAEIDEAAARLSALAAPGGPLNPLVRDVMRPSGRFARHEALDDAAFMAAAWREAAAGLNRLYRVYGLAEAPRYPDIDSISYDPASRDYQGLVRDVAETQIDAPAQGAPFFADGLRVGLDLLLINQRDEAARYEPMEAGANAAALARAAALDWGDWPYTAILVPGAGTLPGETGLSAAGALRLRLAARRYEAGLAPFIVVSGGHVHPNKTPYAEAIEMKARLMAVHGVPEDAILIDPHARHTTTNLRNAVRLIAQAGAPLDRAMLVTTARNQSAYIETPGFAERCVAELGYAPHTVVSRLSPHDLVVAPNRLSLHSDPNDPLDP